MNVLGLFSGIGGFELGLERAGFNIVGMCEIDPYCRAVLRKHWPGVPIFEDVRTLTGADVPGVDVICGGFPCQDISVAGKGAGIEGERSGLWREFARLIGEIRPLLVVVENVSALLGRGLARVLGDLSSLGYDAEWHCIPASAVGAPHQRDRIWIVAYPIGNGLQEREYVGWLGKEASESQQERREANGIPAQEGHADPDIWECSLGAPLGRMGWLYESIPQDRNWPLAAEPCLGRGIDGVPARLDRCMALGNAVVPQIPEIIGRAIMKAAA